MARPPFGLLALHNTSHCLRVAALATTLACFACAANHGPPTPPPVSSAPVPDPNATSTAAGAPTAPTDVTTQPVSTTSTTAPPRAPKKQGPDAGDRARSAFEGLLMGAIIGSQAGPIGAAVVAASAMVYGAAVGDVPFGGGSHSDRDIPTETERENEIDEELDRQASLEDEIQQELKRQEELLNQIDNEEGARPAPASPNAPSAADVATKANPRVAPSEPKLRDLPASVFEEKHTTIPTADGKGKQAVLARKLDADRDGKPEEVRYFDEKTAQLVRVEEDRDYDGRIDAWDRYTNGVLTSREVDENGDGKVDAWETYAGGRMTSREVDRDGNGSRDAFYVYSGGALVEERHDTKGSGKIDRIVHYSGGHITTVDEDRDGNGQIDAWSHYAVDPNGNEVVVKVERDSKGDGKPDVFETYEQQDGKTALVRREEDVNQDGTPDIVSIYDKGKLVKREISDPALTPL
jgi:hypothetical protein